MKLVFILEIGENHNNEVYYEFIFSEDPENANGDYWHVNGMATPPHEKFISKIGVLKSREIHLHALHKCEFFSYVDAIEEVIAIAWENIDNPDYELSDTEKRLVFNYGEDISSVEQKLYSRDLILKYNGI